MLEIFYNSQDLKYKSPFGALKSSSLANFRLDVECDVDVKAFMSFNKQLIEMKRASLDGHFYTFEYTYNVPQEPGLVYYHFVIETPYHRVFYGNNSDRLQAIGKKYDISPIDYQITVYDDFTVPKWAKGKIMYQIFPDRFYKEEILKSPFWDRYFHENWDDLPFIEGDFPSKTMENSDFFGGNLRGIINKLDYIQGLGVGIIYLNPIYRAYSNHRYDLADYMSIDDSLGTKDDLKELCDKAKKRGIHIILDMVFSHTGSDSIYFNKKNTFESLGAYKHKDSPYRSWYTFLPHGKYESWWGIDTLPNVDETNPTFIKHILDSLEMWMDLGVKGFRLDVADELPDDLIKAIRRKIKDIDPESILIGEVWEDASNKESYGVKREYLFGYELDSVMNYPFRKVLIDYSLGHIDGKTFCRQIMIIKENYPKEVFEVLMNMLGTHDVSRILTLLGGQWKLEGYPRKKQGKVKLNKEEYEKALKRLDFILNLLVLLPGIVSIYYGDEAGLEGLKDPFNRKTFPWDKINEEVMEIYKKALEKRSNSELLKYGDFCIFEKDQLVFIERYYMNESITYSFDNNKIQYKEI